MSYNIGVVNFKLPDDFEGACRVFDEHADDETVAVLPDYQAFHDEITKAYPCISSLPEDEVDEGVWCDGPLINNFAVKAPVIGFVFSRVEEALPVVGNKALEMGLSILDWQSERVYNP